MGKIWYKLEYGKNGKNLIQIGIFFLRNSLWEHAIEIFIWLMNKDKIEIQMVAISKDWKDHSFLTRTVRKDFTLMDFHFSNIPAVIEHSGFSLHPVCEMKMVIMLIVSGNIFETQLTNISFHNKHEQTFSHLLFIFCWQKENHNCIVKSFFLPMKQLDCFLHFDVFFWTHLEKQIVTLIVLDMLDYSSSHD